MHAVFKRLAVQASAFQLREDEHPFGGGRDGFRSILNTIRILSTDQPRWWVPHGEKPAGGTVQAGKLMKKVISPGGDGVSWQLAYRYGACRID